MRKCLLCDPCGRRSIRTEGECTLVPHERHINLYATIVKQSLHLLVDGHEADHLDFGNVYYGRKKTIWGKLVNDGPVAVPFQSIHQRSDEEVPREASAADKAWIGWWTKPRAPEATP